ncbi:type II toxin-antitoxin system HipA family toxin [Caldimonas tepidiphila]|uniref:type II toxin-antitoxin system HipA family toxin n=1 Tax=Caldimonas tepidiphila TaxID=2315841 RepID=UPI000E5AED55|nr:HipA domain-containing protein [Caldimonas tepidiphila]
MTKACTLQLHVHDTWHDVASVSLMAFAEAGSKAATYTAYDMTWAVEHQDARAAHALGCQFPVQLEAVLLKHWPPCLIDLLPQGFGRGELLRCLGMPETARDAADWPLLMVGAGNPVGNLRVKAAAAWLAEHQGPLHGFNDAEVSERSEVFCEYLAEHGLFAAGSAGVQGEWPKLLLTRADDGLLYLDHTLPDARARQHYIVKFGRGANERLAQVLRHEGPYMELAQRLGLRVHAPLLLRERVLFIPRFDRRVRVDGGVERLGQESIASLTGRVGEYALSHDEVCWHLVRRCTAPQAEVLEYLRRDVANLALGNKDNHSRNTALQRDFDGRITLTPLYDFAPMYLHPNGIARRIRWRNNDGGCPDWARVLDAVVELSRPHEDKGERDAPLQREPLVEGLRAMAAPLTEIARHGVEMGLEPNVHAHLRLGLEEMSAAMAHLT